MKHFILELNTAVRSILKNKSNLIVILLVAQLFLMLYIYVEITDSIYHFYMNTTTTIEKLHNVTIDRYNGNIKRELSTEEELIRKQTKKFHLYYLLKNIGL